MWASVIPVEVVPIGAGGDTPSILAVAHWDRLMGGLLYAASARLPWAQLLRRTFSVDVEECPRCHGRLRLMENITEPAGVGSGKSGPSRSGKSGPLKGARDGSK